ncbi:MAG: hypothetical protein AB1938_08105 [Myxococcota bacterium]
MKRSLMMLVPAVLSLTACGGGMTADLVGSYTGTTTYTWERYSFTTTLSSTVDIFDSPDGDIDIVASGRQLGAPPNNPTITCRLKGKPTMSGFEIEPGAACVLEGFWGNCNATASIISASAVRSAASLTVSVRVQGGGCAGTAGEPDYFSLRGTLIKTL